MASKIRIAACHISPVFLNAAQTTLKAISHIRIAASNGANLVVFPESYIAAFPVWSALQAPSENHVYFRRMVAASISMTGPEMASVQQAAREQRIAVSLGFSEHAQHHSAGTLYNSNVLLSAAGDVLVHHRKLVPTFFEKLTWAPGDGAGLVVAATEHARVGALICGENTNPLARYSLMAQGEQVHISTWPAIWPTRRLDEMAKVEGGRVQPGVDTRDVQGEAREKGGKEVKDVKEEASLPLPAAKNYDNVAANRIRAAAHCFEAKCFGVLSAAHLDHACIDELCSDASDPAAMRAELEAAPRAATMFLDPTGALIPGYTIDAATGTRTPADLLQHAPGVLYADLDLRDCVEGKQYHDVTGGYQRLDVFQLTVNRTRREPVTII